MDIDRPVSTVRVYSLDDIELNTGAGGNEVSPVMVIERSNSDQGPNIRMLRWLRDSRGLAFLAKDESGGTALFMVELESKRLERLSPADVIVNGFDVQDREHFVFTALSAELQRRIEETAHAVTLTLSDEPIDVNAIVSASAPLALRSSTLTHSELWVSTGGRPARIQGIDGRPVVLHNVQNTLPLALSPDRRWVATMAVVGDVPEQWGEKFNPGPTAGGFRVHAGRQDTSAPSLYYSTNQYVLVDVLNGAVSPLVEAPTGDSAGWWYRTIARWRADGEYVAVTNTFLSGGGDAAAQAPCLIAVIYPSNHRQLCRLRADSIAEVPNLDDGDWLFDLDFESSSIEASFLTVSGRRVQVHISEDGVLSTMPDGDADAPSVSVRQDLQTPPELVAKPSRSARAIAIWRPNAYLDDVQLARVSRLDWTDQRGRKWSGGLFLPPSMRQGDPGPLVLQTHGFDDTRFNPAGMFTNASAAQALAAHGIVVLQVQDCPASGVEEADCQIEGYRAAITELAGRGLIDTNRIGLQGFSRTSYYVLAALTRPFVGIRAAIISDGITGGYMQSLLHRYALDDAMAFNGGAPFGADIHNWLNRSPVFNLHRAHTALRIEATSGVSNAVFMWEPYAVLNYLGRPVEFVYYTRPGTHPLTNPRQRLASQQGALDWFRFWLQEYEDPSPDKSEQYRRWRGMRERF